MPSKIVNKNEEYYDIYIGRPGKWGNPYSYKNDTLAKYKVSSLNECIEKYEEFIRNNIDLMNDLHELRGKILGCFCKPGKCHGDILLKLLNEKYPEDYKEEEIF